VRECGISHRDIDLVQILERQHVQIRCAHHCPQIVDDHQLLVDHRRLVFEQPNAGIEQRAEQPPAAQAHPVMIHVSTGQ
jgi:hypothetical protein